MKDMEPIRHFFRTSATRLTLCEVAQHDTPMGPTRHFVMSLAAGEPNAKVLHFSTESKECRQIKRLDSRALICRCSRESRRRGAERKRRARQMKCDNVTPVKSDRKLLPSRRLI